AAGATPARVATLAPNLTEIVFAVGAGGSLVGVSEYSDYPPAARALPRVGGLEVSAERVVSLRPDLVLATPEGNAKGPVNALAAAGIPVLAVAAGSLETVIEGIRLVGGRLNRSEAADRVARGLDALERLEGELRKLGRGDSVASLSRRSCSRSRSSWASWWEESISPLRTSSPAGAGPGRRRGSSPRSGCRASCWRRSSARAS